MSPWVDIHYRRLPDGEQVYTQQLLLDRDDVRVTFARNVAFESPVVIHDEVALESGSDAIWFTFPDRWHDIGRFHRRDDTFTGIYANILTPPVFVDGPGGGRDGEGGDGAADGHGPRSRRRPHEVWRTTDLFLDVWLPREGGLFVLDRDQLDQALREGWVSPELAARARKEVARIEEAHEGGSWPPRVVEEWTLERARQEAEARGP